MLSLVLDSLGWQRPEREVGGELTPTHAGDLFPPHSGQQQELDHRSERIAECVRGPPNFPQLSIGMDTLTPRLRCRILHPLAGGELQRPPLDAPTKQPAQNRKRPVGHGWRAVVDDDVNQRHHIDAGDGSNGAVTPVRDGLTLQNAFAVAPGLVMQLGVALDEAPGDDFKRLRGLCTRAALDERRIVSFCDGRQRCARGSTRGRKLQHSRRTDRELDTAAADPLWSEPRSLG